MTIVVAVLIAVGGWIANGVLERRSVRRRMRIDYLLAAYRDLDSASNRAMTVDHEAAIESAISQIQLLGTPRQVELADEFVEEFASAGTADMGPLLEDLRTTLRDELLLEGVPARRMWLRITREGQWAQESARVRTRMRAVASSQLPDVEVASDQLTDVVDSDATEAVVEAYAAVENAVRNRLTDSPQSVGRLTGSALARLALDQLVINKSTAEAIDGLTVMRNLAIHGGQGVTAAQAQEFRTLADTVLYVLHRDAPASDSTAG